MCKYFYENKNSDISSKIFNVKIDKQNKCNTVLTIYYVNTLSYLIVRAFKSTHFLSRHRILIVEEKRYPHLFGSFKICI
jgi:hypothetical protein